MQATVVGRETERARIDELLDGARVGRSGTLVVSGEPGIGKTALLRWAGARARDMLVLTARGVEAESNLAFAGLAELLRPLLGRLDELPAPQAAALRIALGADPGRQRDPHTPCIAVLGLLALAAEERPLLVIVDDAHWLDDATATCLRFVARRLEAEGVALLLARRPDASAPPGPEMALAGLGRAAAAALLAEHGLACAGPVGDRLVAATGGNPLALVETAALLTADQREGAQPLPRPLPAAASAEQVYRLRIDRLGSGARTALLVAAASRDGALGAVAAAAGELGAGPGALEAAERAGLVTLAGGRVEFAHPLLRSVAYHAAPADERRAAHRALAGAATGDLRAWHLGEATVFPDEQVAALLEDAGRRWHARGGGAAAAQPLERAARLTPDDDPGARARRLTAAAEALAAAGAGARSLGLLEEAVAVAPDASARADAQLVRARIETFRAPRDAAAALEREANRVHDADPGRAALLLVDVAIVRQMAGDTRGGLAAARRADAAGRQAGGIAAQAAAIALGQAEVLSGDAGRGARQLEDLEEVLLGGAGHGGLEVPALARAGVLGAVASLWLGRAATAERVLRAAVARARRLAAPGELALPLGMLAEVELHTGRWAACEADGSESARLAAETGQEGQHAHALVTLARLEAGRGRAARVRSHLDAALPLADALGAEALLHYARSAEGRLALGAGDLEAAIAALEGAGRLARRHGTWHPSVSGWQADLAEAYARAGRTAEAQTALAELEQAATAAGDRRALAAAARCRGLVTDDDAAFEEALAGPLEPFERARTELCYGERLRRRRRRAAAREQLHAALSEFERLGAEPWAERARGELGRAGVASVRGPALEELTPHELRVALLVADGATNREAAAALFVSPKTVDFHLRGVYRKLSIRSRTELARLIGDRDGVTGPGAASANRG